MFAVLLGAAALGLSSPSAVAWPLKVQGCVRVDGLLTQGAKVEAFDSRSCTFLASAVTDPHGDFVLYGPSGSFNENAYLQVTGPDGCLQIVDNATVRSSMVTDPNDGRYGWIALCVDMQCACVPCTTGISKVVLQYLGTSDQVIAAWATTTTAIGSKSATSGSKAKTTTGTSGSKSSTTKTSGSKGTSTKPGSKPVATPATPLFCAPVKPCTTFTIIAPTTPVSASGSKGAKTGSKGHQSGSKNKDQKAGMSGLTLFVGNNVNTRLDLSCSGGVTNGQVIGMFKVIRLENAAGQRVCPAPKAPKNCLTSGKPNQITFQYVGGNCSTAVNSQPRGAKYNCTDCGAITPGPVRIVISSSSSPCSTGFFAGTVIPGATFVVRAGRTGSKSKGGSFGDQTYAYIYSGGVLVERIQINTSCSAPLIPGETFGALKLVTYAIVP